MENDADFAGERDLGPFGAAAFGDRDGPGLELRPRCDTRHQHVGRLEQGDPHRGIAGATDGAGSIGVAGLITPGRQAKAWPIALEKEKRSGRSTAARKVSATTAPTPGIVINR
jgi:hypothetical protein